MTDRTSPLRRWRRLRRWLYRGDRPHYFAKLLNRFWARQYGSAGKLARARDVELIVKGRTSGNPIAVPVVLADIGDQWYVGDLLGGQRGCPVSTGQDGSTLARSCGPIESATGIHKFADPA